MTTISKTVDTLTTFFNTISTLTTILNSKTTPTTLQVHNMQAHFLAQNRVSRTVIRENGKKSNQNKSGGRGKIVFHPAGETCATNCALGIKNQRLSFDLSVWIS